MTQRTTQHATIMKSSKRRWRATAAASLAAVTAATLGLAAAPTASAAPALPCAGQDFVPGNHYCTVAVGETILFSIKSGDGGAGGAYTNGGAGGLGGLGLVVTGTYTNTSGIIQTMLVIVGSNGAPGSAGTPGTDGNAGALSTFGVQGSFDGIVNVLGGTGGTAGGSNSPGNNGTQGSVSVPNPLTAGWIATPTSGTPFARFSGPPSSAASGPADLLQQVEVPASGSCADVKDSDLKWGTDLTGGWSKAWGEWANRFVCSRTFHYGANGWEISPA